MARSMGRVRFGPGSVIYLVVMGLITFAAIYTQANLLFWALGLVVGALVVSLGSAVIALRGIEVRRLAPSRGVADEPLVLRYHLENRSRLACFGVEITEVWQGGRGGSAEQGASRLWGKPQGWVLHVGPGQSMQAEATCWPKRRGSLRLQGIEVTSSFPFGIIRKTVRFTQRSEVLIHPPQRRLNRQVVLGLANRDIGHARHADRGGGTDEFFGLRPYRPGDGYKLIDWKHSARTSQLVSREMAKARPPKMLIQLDVTLPKQAPTESARGVWIAAHEEAISLAAALVRESQQHGVHVGLIVRGAACPWLGIHNSPAHRQRVLDSLARLDLSVAGSGFSPPARPTVLVKVLASDPTDPMSQPTATVMNAPRGGLRQRRIVLSRPGEAVAQGPPAATG